MYGTGTYTKPSAEEAAKARAWVAAEIKAGSPWGLYFLKEEARRLAFSLLRQSRATGELSPREAKIERLMPRAWARERRRYTRWQATFHA